MLSIIIKKYHFFLASLKLKIITLNDDDFGYCYCCNRHIYIENAHWIDNDNILCDQCFATETNTCDHCGEIVFKDELTFNRELDEYLCIQCKEHYEEAQEFKRRYI